MSKDNMNMDDLSAFEVKDGEVDAFGGKSREDVVGRFADDPITRKQMAMIYALGKEMDMEKDDIKDVYDIDSISRLTLAEAGDIITQMQGDKGDFKDQKVSEQTELEKGYAWTREAGISRINNKFAKCGHCKSFTGENTLCDGKCEKGINRGVYAGSKVIPMTEDCFEFKHGKLQRKTEDEVVMPKSDYNPDDQ